tara:strand:- start:39 stop:404 length:366 start_codon:yes stop_codon:yes gene_type:complete
MRKQNGIYWPPATANDFGRPGYGTLVELIVTSGGNYRLRWEDTIEEFIDGEGTLQQSSAKVFVPVLPGGGEVLVGGWLWLGDVGDLTSTTNPRGNPGAYEVRNVGKLPNLKATEFLRTVML